jgi:hypothetical protein
MGERMDLPADAQAVRIVADSWTTLFATSFVGMGQSGDDPVDAAILCARLEATFAVFTRTWLPWRTAQEPNR